MQKNKTIILLTIFLVIIIGFSAIIQAQNIIYTIQKGDTLINIANKFNCSLEKIIKINEIKNPDKIIVGNNLKVPQTQKTYKVKKGDTLSKIARKLSITVKKIINLNNIVNPDKILVGRNLTVPANTDINKRYNLNSRRNTLHFVWPVQGKISSYYGWREHPIRHERDYHKGIDIAVSIGSPVYAAEEGIVIYSGWSQGYGRLVIIQHRNNKKTYYAHNLRLLVNKGDRIKQGKIIALSGSSGVSTGPHVHFEIRDNNKTIDPLRYLNKQYLKNNFKL